MSKKFFILLSSAIFCALSLGAGAGDVIERIVATVNGHIILQSDWEDAIRYEAFIAGRPLNRLSLEDRKSALDRLIDQELLREQVHASDSQNVSAEEVVNRLAEIRKQYPGADTQEGWRAALSRYGLTEEGLKSRLAMQIELMRLVDLRLRPNVSVDSKSIESYYNQELVPQLRHTGGKDVALAQVTPEIKELLTQQKMSQLLSAWLQDLRAGSEIRTATPSPEVAGQAR
jgi:peptidyl-prolyl cis-trans isomerase SurA